MLSCCIHAHHVNMIMGIRHVVEGKLSKQDRSQLVWIIQFIQAVWEKYKRGSQSVSRSSLLITGYKIRLSAVRNGGHYVLTVGTHIIG